MSDETVRSVLARHGWRLLGRRRRGGLQGFRVARRGAGKAIFELVVGKPSSVQAAGARPIGPSVRLRLRAGARSLQAAEKAGARDLARVLGLLLESRLARDGRTPAPERGETHAGSETREGAGVEHILRTTFACNQRCPFCFVSLTGRSVDLRELSRDLSRLARRHNRRRELTISGGEPTADPRLTRIIALARSHGFRRFVLQTNAVCLSRPGLVDRLVAAGVRTFFVSFHSHRPSVYDRLTGSRGQNPRAAAGLRNLVHCGHADVTVSINVVVNALNYRSLPALAGWLGRLCRGAQDGFCQPGVFFSMLNERGHEKVSSWAVDLGLVAPYLRRALARCRAEGLGVERFTGETAFPLCLLDEPDRVAPRRALPQWRVRYAGDFTGAGGAVGRAKRPDCRECRLDAKCLGVPASYARLFGLGALAGPLGSRPGAT
ncbi:MAG: radical SAM protein [Elusimicrobiota bacterium]